MEQYFNTDYIKKCPKCKCTVHRLLPDAQAKGRHRHSSQNLETRNHHKMSKTGHSAQGSGGNFICELYNKPGMNKNDTYNTTSVRFNGAKLSLVENIKNHL